MGLRGTFQLEGRLILDCMFPEERDHWMEWHCPVVPCQYPTIWTYPLSNLLYGVRQYIEHLDKYHTNSSEHESELEGGSES